MRCQCEQGITAQDLIPGGISRSNFHVDKQNIDHQPNADSSKNKSSILRSRSTNAIPWKQCTCQVRVGLHLSSGSGTMVQMHHFIVFSLDIYCSILTASFLYIYHKFLYHVTCVVRVITHFDCISGVHSCYNATWSW